MTTTHLEIWRHRLDNGQGEFAQDKLVERFGPEADLAGVENRVAIYSDYAEEYLRQRPSEPLYEYYVKEVVDD